MPKWELKHERIPYISLPGFFLLFFSFLLWMFRIVKILLEKADSLFKTNVLYVFTICIVYMYCIYYMYICIYCMYLLYIQMQKSLMKPKKLADSKCIVWQPKAFIWLTKNKINFKEKYTRGLFAVSKIEIIGVKNTWHKIFIVCVCV